MSRRSQYSRTRPPESLGTLERCGAYALRAEVPHHDSAPLLDKSCRPVSADDDKRIRLERMVEPPVYLESPISLSLEERVSLEREVEEEGARPVLSTASAAYLWLCFFLNCFGTITGFQSLMRLMDGWSGSMSGEMNLCLGLFLCPNVRYHNVLCVLYLLLAFSPGGGGGLHVFLLYVTCCYYLFVVWLFFMVLCRFVWFRACCCTGCTLTLSKRWAICCKQAVK